MKKNYQGLSLLDHLMSSEQLLLARSILLDLKEFYAKRYSKSHIVPNQLESVLNSIDKLRSSLDDEYHSIATEEEFYKHGHVYYRPARAAWGPHIRRRKMYD